MSADLRDLNMFDYRKLAAELHEQGQPFVLATVVRAERPTSAKPGAKALITADGTLRGWVGGSCAEPTVRREARRALLDGQPRFLRLCPPEEMARAPQAGVLEVALTCISGGTLEIFIEPQRAQPHLLVVGHLATSEALASLGSAMGYPVTIMGLDVTPDRFPEAAETLGHIDLSQVTITPNTYIIVASHGNYDEEALEASLRSEARYVALIASKTRAEAALQYLHDSNLTHEQIARLKYPAGLDFGAVTPEEIALSILAEIVLHWRARGKRAYHHQHEHVTAPHEARDPVCGMMVEIATTHFITEHAGATYYFCASGCKRAFVSDPDQYLVKE